MRLTLQAFLAIFVISSTPAVVATSGSAQAVSGLPQAATQTQLGNCDLQLWLRHVGYRVDPSLLPPNTRILSPWDEYRANDDNTRLTVAIDARGIIRRMNCG